LGQCIGAYEFTRWPYETNKLFKVGKKSQKGMFGKSFWKIGDVKASSRTIKMRLA